MLQLIQVTSEEHITHVRQLFLEYVHWLHEKAQQEYGITFDIAAIYQMFLQGIQDFYPPQGRLYLASYDRAIVGVGCLKQLGDGIGEIKRMFVRPEYRRKGIGKAILDKLVAEARTAGCTLLRLDSPKVSTSSHRLYQSRGFLFIQPYPGSEGAGSNPELFVYMELVL